ncbi:MAG: VWA domain-containing protein [Hyphomicrobiaceae bacterium]
MYIGFSRSRRRANLFAATASSIALFTAGASTARADAPIEIVPELSQRIVSASGSTRIYLRIGIKVARLERASRRAPLNLALVIDRSGSMQGARIEGARQAAMMAVDRLSSHDIVSIVSYDDKIGIEVPATRVGTEWRIKDRIRALTPRGSTAIHAGVMAGLGEVRKFQSKGYINRIILLSDGLANVGPRTPEHFASLGREIAGEGVTVSTIGLGLGYNEDLMSRLAINADGTHVFVQEPADLTAFLSREIDDVQSIFAQHVDVTIEFDEGVRPLRGLGRAATIDGNRLSWKVGQLVGGSEQVLLAEIEAPAGLTAAEHQIANVRVEYDEAATGKRQSHVRPVALRASDDGNAIQTSFSASVMRDATILDTRERKDAAIRLRDAGKYDEARKAFTENARQISEQAAKYGFTVEGLLRDEQEANQMAASPAVSSHEAWNKQRKIMRGHDANQSGASVKY